MQVQESAAVVVAEFSHLLVSFSAAKAMEMLSSTVERLTHIKNKELAEDGVIQAMRLMVAVRGGG